MKPAHFHRCLFAILSAMSLVITEPTWAQTKLPAKSLSTPVPMPALGPPSAFSVVRVPMVIPRNPAHVSFSVPSTIKIPNVRSVSIDEGTIQYAREFGNFLRSIRGEEQVCRAIKSLFDVTAPSNQCATWSKNTAKTVFYQVTITDRETMTYTVDLLGKSAELALKHAWWVERHRFYVAFGFDARLMPQVTVSAYEPMFRPVGNLDVNDSDVEHLYEHMGRDRESRVKELEARIKRSIYEVLIAARDVKQLVETR